MKKNAICILMLTLVFFGCAGKNNSVNDEYNLSDLVWLEKIVSYINDDNLDKADNAYMSLYSEHINSPLLGNAMFILSSAHAKRHEYLLANYYIDEYIKLYGNNENYEWLNYLKIKNNFNAFVLPKRNQFLLLKTIDDIKSFLNNFSNTKYSLHLNTMMFKLEIAKYSLELEIGNLYNRLENKESVEIYKEKIDNNGFNNIEYIKPKLPWYRNIFEKSYF